MYTLLSDSRKINISNLLLFLILSLATVLGGFDSVLLTNRFDRVPLLSPLFFIREKAEGGRGCLYMCI